MAIGIGKAILAGLTGAAQGAATLALAEDERRKEDTQLTFKAGLKAAETYRELRAESTKELKEELALVEIFKDTVVNGQPIGRAGATALVRGAKARGYSNPEEMLEDYTLSGEGSLEIQAPTKVSIIPKGIDLEKDDEGIFAKGRTKSVVSDVESLLKASNVSTEFEIPEKPKVSGITFTRKPDTEVELDTDYLLDANNTPIQQVITRREFDPQTKQVTITHLDNVTGQQITLAEGQKISSSADAFSQEKPFSDFGPLMIFGDDGLPELLRDSTGKVISGYLMKNGEIRIQKAGKISDEVYDAGDDTVLVAGKDYAPSVASGDLSTFGKMFRFPPVKDLYTKLPELDTAAGANDILFSRSRKRLDLHARYGDSMYGIEGGFADLVTATDKFVKGTASIVLGLSGMKGATLEEKISYLDSSGQISDLKYVVDNQDELMKGVIGTSKEISMARTIDAAIATVTAYDLAKQTGDTRISNQDFDAYISTVTGNNAEQTINLIRNGLDDSLTIYTSKYEAVTRARDRIPNIAGTEQFQEVFDKVLTTAVHPSVYRQQYEEMFAPAQTTEEIKKEAEEVNTEASKYVVQKRLVNPDTGEKDPDGIEAIVVERNGEIQRYPDGSPIVFDPSKYTTDSVNGYILKGLIQDNKILAPKD